ncbi:hypothetical protein [Dapis sp. BLCC M172]|uniref:hypothetical protein n=1 Tax=Dapis sp. BLCC M172 TaxID=2975281 RepID=UPI003CF1A79D
MSGSIGIASEKVRKKEEGRRKKKEEKEKPNMAVDISSTFTRSDTNGHNIN